MSLEEKGRGRYDTQRHRGEGHVKKEAELGVMKLQGPRENAKDFWQPPETRREAWNRFSICEPKQMLIHTYGLNERLINVCF